MSAEERPVIVFTDDHEECERDLRIQWWLGCLFGFVIGAAVVVLVAVSL